MQKPEINTETYLRKKKIKRENMEERDTIICLKKRNKNYKNIKKKNKKTVSLKILNLINKIVF